MHPDRLGPRDLRSAALTSAALVVAGTLAMLSSEVTAAMAGESHALPLVGLVSAGLLGVVVAVVLGYEAMPPLLWVALALAMVGLILVMDLVTDDAGGGAQMAFLFPVVYAGAFLRASAAWLVTGVAAAGHGTLVFALLPPETALPDMIFGLVVMLGLTAVLTASGRRQDALTRTLRTMASVDLLTGLATRRALETAAEIAPDAAPGRALVLVDVDRFKDLNDAYGHPVGDGVLVHLASVLQSVVRAGDTVARWGGDEIAILMTAIGPDDAVRRAEAVREAVVARPLAHEGRAIGLTVSVGVAHSSTAGADLAALYAAADEALYGAKRAGRDQVVVGTGTTPPGSRTLVR
ncbi:GGDEF domain-containing protein [Actinotalea solisilvae]|uniref:GGDEF domain-containing protein n=1 Tax=Actinotalea solisilvae TaxID=2072922 RepID=UPI0018F20BEC|nr:GGDEF domain-containing protein [Actinotalea solisilvae]